jgi:ribosomal protein S18 acetylase RimI-like enzyme
MFASMDAFTIRRLVPGDEQALAELAEHERDFTGEDSSPALSLYASIDYLRDPHVWHWHAEHEGRVVGFLMAYVHRQRHGKQFHVMFDEIGVRAQWRRRGIGRALVEALHAKMKEEGIEEVWVLADNPEAQTFYETCGYELDELQGEMLTFHIS